MYEKSYYPSYYYFIILLLLLLLLLLLKRQTVIRVCRVSVSARRKELHEAKFLFPAFILFTDTRLLDLTRRQLLIVFLSSQL